MSRANLSHILYYEWNDGVITTRTLGIVNPLPEQKVLAEELLKLVYNRDIVYGGKWLLAHTEVEKDFYDKMSCLFRRYVPTELEAMWLDKDGDVQFKIVFDGDVWDFLNHGVTHMADKCEEAYDVWRSFYKSVDVQPSQAFKRAQGEAPITGIEAPVSLIT